MARQARISSRRDAAPSAVGQRLGRSCYVAREIAADLGMSLETFYRRREDLHQTDGMPRPVSAHGRLRIDRASYDAWRGRFHPLAIAATPANDTAPLRDPTIDEERAALAAAYGRD